MSTTLLIDGDIFAYQLACAEETAIEINGVHMLSADADVGKENLKLLLDGFMERTGADKMVVAISDKHNFRKDVLPTYKSNRDGIRRPMILGPLKDFLTENYECVIRPGLEADDVLGILATNPKKIPGRKIIVTEDKDLRQVPGLHWNPKKEGAEKPFEPSKVAKKEGDQFFLSQILSGDMVDGYPGCPGIGKVGAMKLVQNPVIFEQVERELKSGPNKGQIRMEWRSSPINDVWACIVSLYEKNGLTEQDAITTAQVARILRHEDYDYKNKEPILWNPQRLS